MPISRPRIGHAYVPILVPRRLLLQLSLSSALLPLSANPHSSNTRTATLIRKHCTAYLSARGASKHVLWRGGEPPGFSNPASDLFDGTVYGENSVSFFRGLNINSNGNHLHVAAADRYIAADWGTPASIWPIGNSDAAFRYYYWGNCKLIYEESGNYAKKKECGTLQNENLEDALEAGKEVVFDAPRGFFVVSEEETEEIVRLLDADIRVPNHQ